MAPDLVSRGVIRKKRKESFKMRTVVIRGVINVLVRRQEQRLENITHKQQHKNPDSYYNSLKDFFTLYTGKFIMR